MKQLNKIQMFTWEGINKRGIRVKGKNAGWSIAGVQEELKRQGIEPFRVRKKIRLLSFRNRVRTQDILLLSHHLASIVAADIPLVLALEILIKGKNKIATKKLLQAVRDDVASGKSFHESLAKHPTYFNALFTNLIKAGETSGTIDIMLKRLANHMDKSESLKRRIKKAMFYPITVLSLSLLIAGLLLIFIVPQFESLFQSFGAHLPAFTRIVISISRCLQTFWYLILFGMSFITFLFIYGKKNSGSFSYLVDTCLLHLPLFGNLISKTVLARVARTLSTTLGAGLPLLDSLHTVASIANNNLYREALIQVREEITTGQLLHTAMEAAQIFPNMVVQMIAVGEESGSINEMLDKVATFYEEDVNHLVDALSTIIEPLVMVILSLIIGSFVLAMYLPIFKLGSIM